mgnify:CR=1 FL=1
MVEYREDAQGGNAQEEGLIDIVGGAIRKFREYLPENFFSVKASPKRIGIMGGVAASLLVGGTMTYNIAKGIWNSNEMGLPWHESAMAQLNMARRKMGIGIDFSKEEVARSLLPAVEPISETLKYKGKDNQGKIVEGGGLLLDCDPYYVEVPSKKSRSKKESQRLDERVAEVYSREGGHEDKGIISAVYSPGTNLTKEYYLNLGNIVAQVLSQRQAKINDNINEKGWKHDVSLENQILITAPKPGIDWFDIIQVFGPDGTPITPHDHPSWKAKFEGVKKRTRDYMFQAREWAQELGYSRERIKKEERRYLEFLAEKEMAEDVGIRFRGSNHLFKQLRLLRGMKREDREKFLRQKHLAFEAKDEELKLGDSYDAATKGLSGSGVNKEYLERIDGLLEKMKEFDSKGTVEQMSKNEIAEILKEGIVPPRTILFMPWAQEYDGTLVLERDSLVIGRGSRFSGTREGGGPFSNIRGEEGTVFSGFYVGWKKGGSYTNLESRLVGVKAGKEVSNCELYGIFNGISGRGETAVERNIVDMCFTGISTKDVGSIRDTSIINTVNGIVGPLDIELENIVITNNTLSTTQPIPMDKLEEFELSNNWRNNIKNSF